MICCEVYYNVADNTVNMEPNVYPVMLVAPL